MKILIFSILRFISKIFIVWYKIYFSDLHKFLYILSCNVLTLILKKYTNFNIYIYDQEISFFKIYNNAFYKHILQMKSAVQQI
jgi:hypothetical protein